MNVHEQAAYDALRSQLERARGWMWHTRSCELHFKSGRTPECVCGLQAFLEEISPTASAPADSQAEAS